MIFLDTVNRSLEFLLVGNIATNALSFVASYVDVDQTSFSMTVAGTNTGASNNTTAVTLVAAPGSGKTRQLKFLSIRNIDTTVAVVTVRMNDNSTMREIVKFSLDPGDTLLYTDGEGFRVVSLVGSVKTTPQIANMARDVFSGNGSTVTFALSNTPPSLNSMLVSINGVTQRPTIDYSLSGSTLTFVTAPVTGTSNVVIVYIGASLAIGTPSAGTVVASSASSVTGTGNTFVMSASPTLTGTIAAAAMTLSSTLAVTGATTLSSTLTGITAAFTKATAGDVLMFTNGGATPRTGYLYSDATYAGMFSGTNGSGSGFLMHTANNLALVVTNGSTRVTVDSAGQVGFGVTPSATGSGKTIEVGFAGSAFWGYQQDRNYLLLNNYFDGSVFKFGGTGYASQYLQIAGTHQWATSSASGTAGATATMNALMTLSAGGQLSNTCTSSYAFLTYSSDASLTTAVQFIDLGRASTTASDILRCRNNVNVSGTNCFVVRGDGNATNTNNSYGAISDRKLKENVSLAGSQLDDILALSKVTSKYNLIADHAKVRQLGLVAQDVLEISPGLVQVVTDERSIVDIDDEGRRTERFEKTGTETLTVNYSVLYMKNVKATGELIEIVRDHESRLAALRQEFDEYRRAH